MYHIIFFNLQSEYLISKDQRIEEIIILYSQMKYFTITEFTRC